MTAPAGIRLRVVPGASRTEVAGRLADAIKVRVAAPSEDGAANRALLDFVASHLRVPRRSVRLLTGAASRVKVVAVDGMAAGEAEARLLG